MANYDHREALFYQTTTGDRVECGLCPVACRIAPGKVGRCNTRYNDDGTLRNLVHGQLAAMAVDPVEKKPLYHFLPGSRTFSVGTPGCNLRCPFCQNCSLSQLNRHVALGLLANEAREPSSLVTEAKAAACKSIAFTYSEPVLGIEFAADVHPIASEAGLPLIFVSNGQICDGAPLDLLSSIAGAANIDLKSFDAKLYRNELGGELEATLNTIRVLKEEGCWVEVTTLVVPGMNDSEGELREIAGFINDVSPEIPWHVSRFHPSYKWNRQNSTPVETIEAACAIGKDVGLLHVYGGNVPGGANQDTICPGCGGMIVRRDVYRTGEVATENGKCKECGTEIAGVGFS